MDHMHCMCVFSLAILIQLLVAPGWPPGPTSRSANQIHRGALGEFDGLNLMMRFGMLGFLALFQFPFGAAKNLLNRGMKSTSISMAWGFFSGLGCWIVLLQQCCRHKCRCLCISTKIQAQWKWLWEVVGHWNMVGVEILQVFFAKMLCFRGES